MKQKIINKLIRLLKTKNVGINGLRLYKPCSFVIRDKNGIKIDKYLAFNIEWDNARILHNKRTASLYVGHNAKLIVNAFNCYAGCRITINDNAKLTLHSGYCNYECAIECFDNITIGNNVKISERVIIRDSDNHTIINGNGIEQPATAPIVIEDNVWIGMNVTILKGVTIGEGAIIAAGAVVTKNIPAHSLAAGIPAKVIKNNITYK